MNPNNEVKPPKKPLIFYYVIAILVVFLINALLMPSIYKASIREVSYSDFLDMLDAKIIEEAQIDDDAITFVATVDGAAAYSPPVKSTTRTWCKTCAMRALTLAR